MSKIIANEIESLDGSPFDLTPSYVTTSSGTQTVSSAIDSRVNSIENNVLLSDKFYGAVYHPNRGLKISEFLTSSDTFEDQEAALQTAVNTLMSNSKYRSLDLEGRLIPVKSQIIINEDLVGNAYNTPNTIMNGAISASSNWELGVDDPVVLYKSTVGNRIESHNMLNVNIICNNRASGIAFSGDSSHNCRFVMCNIMDPAKFGISTVNGPGNGHYIVNTNIIKYNSTMPFAERVAIGIDLGDHNDTKIIGCNIQYCKHGIYARGTSHQIIGNHIYQGEETGLENVGYNAGIVFSGARQNSVISGNYIDNCHILIGDSDSDTTEFRGYASITNNIFTMKDSGADEFILALKTGVANSIPSNIIFTGNQVRKFGVGGFLSQPMRLLTTGTGNWDKISAANLQIKDNYFWGDIQTVKSEIEVTVSTNTTTVTYPVDVGSSAAFGLWPANRCRAVAFQSTGRANRTFVFWNRTSNTQGNIELDVAAAGSATVNLRVST